MSKSGKYACELLAALAFYILLLIIANGLERALRPGGGLKLAINLIPILGTPAVAWVILRQLWRMDELQRRIQLDGIAIAFVCTALITFGWGFAEAGGLPHLSAFAVWPIMGGCWALGSLLAARRYR